MANAGRILILPKGEYNASTTYSMLDLVTYNNASWVCKKTAVGIAPSDANSEYWQKMIDVAGKQDKIKGGATSITNDNLTVNRALVSDANGKVAVSAVTATELGYLDGATGNIQTQLDNKSDEDHTHNPPSLADCGGILPLEKGGTGANDAKEAEYNILAGMTESTATMTDNGQIVFAYTNPSKTGGRLYWRKASVLWDYIKSKMGDIDSASVRYVSDESDANYDWVQVKNANGDWENWKFGNLDGLFIVRNSVWNTDYSFKLNGDTTQTVKQADNGLFMEKKSNSTNGNIESNDTFNASLFSKFKFVVSEFNADVYSYLAIYSGTNLTSQIIINKTGEYEADLSSVSGNVTIRVVMPINKYGKIVFSDMYFE